MAASPFVTPDWLHQRLSAPDIVVLDASWYLPAQGRDAEAEYRAAHIPGAIRFDLDANERHAIPPAPHAAAAGGVRLEDAALGVGDGAQVVVYDGMGLFSAPRVQLDAAHLRQCATWCCSKAACPPGSRGLPDRGGRGPPARPAPLHRPARRRRRGRCRRCRPCAEERLGATRRCPLRPALPWRGGRAAPGRTPRPHAGAKNLHYAALQANGRLRDEASLRAAYGRGRGRSRQAGHHDVRLGRDRGHRLARPRNPRPPPRALYDGSWSEWGSDQTTARGNRARRADSFSSQGERGSAAHGTRACPRSARCPPGSGRSIRVGRRAPATGAT